jgi:hypothetical protein
MSWHRLLADDQLWWLAGRCGGVLLMVGYLRLRPHLPHRHNGYTSMSGHVWPCRRCGKSAP